MARPPDAERRAEEARYWKACALLACILGACVVVTGAVLWALLSPLL